jgi:hypothetical protein
MKTRTSTTRVLGLVLVTAALTGSLAQNALQPTSASPRPAAPATAPAPADADSRTSPAASAPRLSPWTTEIVKLAQAGIDDGVVLSFIQNSGTFNLGADQIIHLAGVGVSSQVINAMLQHDYDLTSGAKLPTISSRPPMDPAVEKALAALRETANEAATPPPLPPSVAAAPDSNLISAPSSESSPQASLIVTSAQPDKSELEDSTRHVRDPVAADANPLHGPADQSGLTSAAPELKEGAIKPKPAPVAAPIPQAPTPPRPKSLYPVREPFAVELVPPILVANAASKTPNLIVIDLFPSSR